MGIFGHLDFIISRLCLKGLHFVILSTPLSKIGMFKVQRFTFKQCQNEGEEDIFVFLA